MQGTLDLWSHFLGVRGDRDELRLPDFLGIGAQKAGSTWLHANLVLHPQLYLPEAKELHYFDWYRTPTLRRYAEEFRPAGCLMAGEITPGYSALSRRRIRRVHRLLPRAKVLLLLRDPIERAWSQLRMDLARKRGRDPGTISPDEVASRLTQRGAWRRSDLAGVVDRWSDHYGDQLWIGAYEDIGTRPEQLLRSVLDHLGVDADIDLDGWPLRERFNAGADGAPSSEIYQLLLDRLGDQRDALRSLVPHIVARWEPRS